MFNTAELQQITVQLFCNNVDNGTFAEKLFGVEIPDWIQLESLLDDDFNPIGLPLLLNINSSTPSIKVEDLEIPITNYATWVGNWCWDAVTMSIGDAAKLLNYLRAQGWGCESAESTLFRRWNDGIEIEACDLRGLI